MTGLGPAASAPDCRELAGPHCLLIRAELRAPAAPWGDHTHRVTQAPQSPLRPRCAGPQTLSWTRNMGAGSRGPTHSGASPCRPSRRLRRRPEALARTPTNLEYRSACWCGAGSYWHQRRQEPGCRVSRFYTFWCESLPVVDAPPPPVRGPCADPDELGVPVSALGWGDSASASGDQGDGVYFVAAGDQQAISRLVEAQAEGFLGLIVRYDVRKGDHAEQTAGG